MYRCSNVRGSRFVPRPQELVRHAARFPSVAYTVSYGDVMTLTREDVVRGAMAVLGEEGHAALSMRRVARELGVSPMALYNHVENRADLVDAIAESFLRWTHEDGGTLAEQAGLLLEGYVRWPYMLDVVREADPGISRAAAEAVVTAVGGEPSRTREDWAALRALAEGLSTADDVDAPAVLARTAAAITA